MKMRKIKIRSSISFKYSQFAAYFANTFYIEMCRIFKISFMVSKLSSTVTAKKMAFSLTHRLRRFQLNHHASTFHSTTSQKNTLRRDLLFRHEKSPRLFKLLNLIVPKTYENF